MDGRGAFSPRIPSVESDDPLTVLERLYGPMTARSRAGLMPETASITALDEDPRVTALREPGAAEGAFGLMGDVAMQPVRAGEALGEAIYDPTLGNVTNAGVQTALTFGKPYVAAGTAGLGMAEALRRDLGLEFFGDTNAQSLTRKQKREMEMERQRQDAQAKADIQRIEAEARAKAGLEVEKDRIAAEAARRAAEAKIEATKRAEYDRAVIKAEASRDKEMGRITRFSDTETGKVYRKVGAAPYLAALGMGALGRSVAKGSGPMAKWGFPALEGTGGAFTATNWPLLSDGYFGTDSDNPEKAAYKAYARDLPAGHPEKESAATYATGLPDVHPIRSTAQKDLWDGFLGRLGSSVLEGAPLGIAGRQGVDLTKKVASSTGRGMGRAAKWVESLFGKSPGPTGPGPSASPPPAPASPAPQGKTAKPKWNEKTQRYHGAHNHIVKGGKPPK